MNQYKKYNEFQFLGSFYVCNLDNKFILIDGQHRLGAINYLINKKKYKSFTILIWLINVESEEELITYFQNINKVKPLSLPDLAQDDQRDIINNVCNELFTKYRKFFSNNIVGDPKRPNLKLDDMKNAFYTKNIRKN